MEMEFFVKPGTEAEWLKSWVQARLEWYVGYGVRRACTQL